MFKKLCLLLVVAGLLGACTTISSGTLDERRANVLRMKDRAISDIAQSQPSVKDRIKRASGYAVFSNANVNLIFASFSGGYGVVHNNLDNSDTYMRSGEAGIGLGLGAKDLRVLMIFKTPTALDRFVESGWLFGAQADATAKATDKGGEAAAQVVADDIEIYQVTEAGLALQATIKGSKFWKDSELNYY